MTADQWNDRYPVGTSVTAYPGIRPERAAKSVTADVTTLTTYTRSRAWSLGHGEPVVMVEGYAGGISLEHVDIRVQTDPHVRAAEIAAVRAQAERRKQLAAARVSEDVLQRQIDAQAREIDQLRERLAAAEKTATGTMTADLFAIALRVLAATDPASCGTCRSLASQGQPAEHAACPRRAVLLPAPDAPDYEDLGDLTDEQRAALPPRFHTPVYDGDKTPAGWLCAVCWGDGWATAWPCQVATKRGGEVFTAEHHAERWRSDTYALANGVHGLTVELDKAQAKAVVEHGVNRHLADKHAATLAATDEWMDERAQLLADNHRLTSELAAIDDEIEEFEAAADGDPATPNGVLLMIQLLRRIRPARPMASAGGAS
jgi:hypothetical protein